MSDPTDLSESDKKGEDTAPNSNTTPRDENLQESDQTHAVRERTPPLRKTPPAIPASIARRAMRVSLKRKKEREEQDRIRNSTSSLRAIPSPTTPPPIPTTPKSGPHTALPSPPPIPSVQTTTPHEPKDDVTRVTPTAPQHPTRPPCPSCGLLNALKEAYCTGCGTPLFDATQISQVGSQDLPRVATPWRVYGVHTETVGREREFDALVSTFRKVVESSSAHIVTLHGPDGIGKSRIVGELNEKLDNLFERAHLIHGSCRGQGESAYGAIARIIRNRFYISEHDRGPSGRAKLTQGIQAIVKSPVSCEIAELVGYLIGIPFPESKVYERYNNDPIKILDRARHALAQLFEHDAKRQPLILAFEDAHKAKTQTLSLLQFLQTTLSSSPILFLIITHTNLQNHHPWLFDDKVTQNLVPIPLKPLSDEVTRELTAHILRRLPSIPESLHELICTHAFGNPLTVEGIIQVLISQNVIDTRGNDWTLNEDDLSSVSLPSSFEGIIQARLETLTTEERSALEHAAILGQTFWFDALVSLDRLHVSLEDMDDSWPIPGQERSSALSSTLEMLARKDMIDIQRSSSIPGQREFSFRHDIERKTLYEAIPEQERTQAHVLAAQWIDLTTRTDEETREQHIETIALHYRLGNARRQAAQATLEAARKAMRQWRADVALERFNNTLSLLDNSDLELRIDILHDIANTYDLIGDLQASRTHLRELLQHAWRLGHRAKIAVGYNKLGRALRTLGHYDKAIRHLTRAQIIFEEIDDLPGVASCLDDIGKVHTIRGDYEDAQTHYTRALDLRKMLGDERSHAVTLNSLATVKLHTGNTKDALIFFRQALDLRKACNDRRGVAQSLNGLAALCYQRGDLDQAQALYTQVESVARDIQDQIMLSIALNNRGELLITLNQLDEAHRNLQEAVEVAQECGERRVLFDALKNLGQLHHKRGDWTRAVELTQQSLSIAQELDARVLRGVALRCFGELYAATLFDESDGKDHVTRAEECFRESIEIFQDIGHESELGHSLSSYGSYLLEQGLIIQGKKRLEMAKEIFKRLHMKRVLSKTSKTIDQL